ncbi:MAG: tRNA lysidine(34) synthetase TilS [Parachlamydiaceae bacterium]
MTDKLIHTVSSFLKTHKSDKPLLIGFSGGPDSLALLHTLLSLKENIAIAHVDHGWREESREEAAKICSMGAELGVPVHMKVLALGNPGGNLEAICRDERLSFFNSLCEKYGYEAVLLGHHADDHAETVLKRILEGAALSNLCGITPETVFGKMKVWRPLLTVTKKDILCWLHNRGLEGFNDRTNTDAKFLRARLRTDLLPYLSTVFGKEVCSGLCHVGNESAELIRYLDNKVSPYLAEISSGPFGSLLDLSIKCPEEGVELKHLLRRFFEKEKITFSREMLAQAVHLISTGAANKSLGDCLGEIDRRRIFLLHSPLPKVASETVLLPKNGTLVWGGWYVSASPSIKKKGFTTFSMRFHSETTKLFDQETFKEETTNWLSLWKGAGRVSLPDGDYFLAPPENNLLCKENISLSKWWSDRKVPAFLRHCAPVILQNGRVRHEFLAE